MGMRTLQFNTQERALSTDVNRLQKFKERDVMELLRMWLTSRGTWEASAGVGSDPQSAAAPSYAEIINGLTPHPINGTFGMIVDPGVAVIVDAAQPDSSAAQYVRDNGVAAAAPLAVTPNGGLFTRFDYLECALATVPETVSDSRDVFDPTTGFFTAAALVKESQVRLQYRVRAGVAGSGLPTADAGWLPLCVIMVPSGAANLDVCTLWDVRPLLSDRAEAGVLQEATAVGDGLWLNFSGPMTAVKGNFRMKHKGRWLGGQLRRGSPGTDGTTIDFSDSSNGSTAGGSTLWTVYALLPGDLPRWCRYSDASAGTRGPRACRGIIVQSDVKPNVDGTPQSAITIPGFSTSTTNGRAVWSGIGSATVAYVIAQGRSVRVGYPDADPSLFANADVSPVPTALVQTYTIVPGVTVPANAKTVHIQARADFVTGAAGLHWSNGASAEVIGVGALVHIPINQNLMPTMQTFALGDPASYVQFMDVPLLSAIEGDAASSTQFRWNTAFAKYTAGTAPTVTNAYFVVMGWEV